MSDIIIANAFNLPLVDSKGQYDGDTRMAWKYEQESEKAKIGFYVKIEMH